MVRTQVTLQAKKEWSTPTLAVHGLLVDVTGQTMKWFGSSDGLTFMGIPIGDGQHQGLGS
ncbi:MAG: hypothetical protein AB1505_25810 [Candidatus Latescibacterota bacterium]